MRRATRGNDAYLKIYATPSPSRMNMVTVSAVSGVMKADTFDGQRHTSLAKDVSPHHHHFNHHHFHHHFHHLYHQQQNTRGRRREEH
eukprot:5064876-Ditylum_brightwellii.AAC.1